MLTIPLTPSRNTLPPLQLHYLCFVLIFFPSNFTIRELPDLGDFYCLHT